MIKFCLSLIKIYLSCSRRNGFTNYNKKLSYNYFKFGLINPLFLNFTDNSDFNVLLVRNVSNLLIIKNLLVKNSATLRYLRPKYWIAVFQTLGIY